MKIPLGVSARHIHLTKEDYDLLFPDDMGKIKDLNQPGEFATDKTVTIKTETKEIKNVRLVGPTRNYTQVEISKTDAIFLGIEAKVARSGHLEEAEDIIIETEKGKIKRKACIIAARHIHISKDDRKKLNLTKDVYKVKVNTEKGGVFDNVYISEREKSYLEMHIDTDDANAFNLKSNDIVEIIE